MQCYEVNIVMWKSFVGKYIFIGVSFKIVTDLNIFLFIWISLVSLFNGISTFVGY